MSATPDDCIHLSVEAVHEIHADKPECESAHLVYPLRVHRSLAFSVLTFLLFLPAILFAREAREEARIDFLIHGVETSAGIKFIRNGSEYDGAAAAKHLRMKLNYAGARLKTAEDFVKYCASESSLTHRKYSIRLADGTTMDATTYFTEQLRKFDEKH